MGLLLISQGVQWGWNPIGWDWLLVSGVTVFLLAYLLSRSFPRLAEETLQRLWDRGIIGPNAGSGDARGHASPRPLADVNDDLEQTARRYRKVGAPVTAVTMGLLWVVAFGGLPWRNGALWLAIALAAVAGAVLARLVAYGRLGAVLTRHGLVPTPQPGHVDNAAGLQPVGALYLRQATVVAAIGVFAGVWWLLIGGYDRYAYWRGPYLGVIIIAIGCEVLAFAAPLWSFHRLMAADKRRRLRDADRASRDILKFRETLCAESAPADQDRLATEVERLTSRWHDIETMPTWPVDARVRRRFTWNNVAVLVPVALKAASAPRWGQDLGEGLGRLLG
jgi:hypothetical protein